MTRIVAVPRALYAALIAATFVAATPSLRAETRRFVPTTFPTTFSSTHAPALRVASGTRISTSTVDDRGTGVEGAAAAGGGNPQTGPFYIEGAEPGDLLVVTLLSLTPNRTTGFSTSVMSPFAIDPQSLSSRQDTSRVPWVIDAAGGRVRLDLQALMRNVNWRSRFASTEVDLPLQPALGSIGVAPAGAAEASTAVGPFGGNLMSAALTTGTRVMLPVFHPGGLLFLGHGYARKGDGGVTGTGIETSLDVEFAVEVVKKKEWPHSSVARPSTVVGEFAQGWPRLETSDYVMTLASGASLSAALQHATLELHHWLDDDFGLSEKAVSILLGQAIEYEIGSVVEPNVTVVAKVRKAYLPPPATAPSTD